MDYDLCKDGKWDVFDLCLLKREVINSMNTKNMDIDLNGVTFKMIFVEAEHLQWVLIIQMWLSVNLLLIR